MLIPCAAHGDRYCAVQPDGSHVPERACTCGDVPDPACPNAHHRQRAQPVSPVSAPPPGDQP